MGGAGANAGELAGRFTGTVLLSDLGIWEAVEVVAGGAGRVIVSFEVVIVEVAAAVVLVVDTTLRLAAGVGSELLVDS